MFFWHMVKNRVQRKMTNIGTIYDIIISDDLEEILFGCAVCANGAVLDKITREPFVVTLNSKTENTFFCITIIHAPINFNLKVKLMVFSIII